MRGVARDQAERLRVDQIGQQVGVLVVVDAAALLLDKEVRCGEGDLQTGRRRDRAERAVRGELGAVGLREGGDAVHPRDAARVGQVGLDDGDTRGEGGQELGPSA